MIFKPRLLVLVILSALMTAPISTAAAGMISPKIGPALQREILDDSRGASPRRDGERIDVILVLAGDPLEALSADRLEAVRSRVSAAGGTVGDHAYNKVQARLPLGAIEALAGWDLVRLIRKPIRPSLRSIPSEGVAVMNAPPWHGLGFTGAGVKVGVVDVGFAGYTELLGRDLPDTVVTQITSSWREFQAERHGTACAEILHDTAPGAALHLVNVGDMDVDFHNAVEWLIDQEVEVVSCSIGIDFNIISALIYEVVNGFFFDAYYASLQYQYMGELREQWAATVTDAVSRGVTWVQAGGNDGKKRWKSEFVDPDGDGYLNFGDGENANEIILPDLYFFGIPVYVVLAWGEEETTDDFDLYITNGWGRDVARSTIIQAEMPEFPMEVCRFFPIPGERYFARVHNYDAAPQVVSLNIGVDGFAHYEHFMPVGTVKMAPPADLPEVITAGAVDVGSPYEIEPYSSQGPNLEGVIKPDVVAPDRVSTQTYGDGGFPGTPAAAPHVAGICAMIRQYDPTLSPGEVKSLLEALALDLGAPGKDNVYGAGLVRLPRIEPICTEIGPDLDLDLRVNYLGDGYAFMLRHFPMPADLAGIYWRMDLGTFRPAAGDLADAILVGADLSISVRADYLGNRYFAPLTPYDHPDDPDGFYWRVAGDAVRVE